MDKSVTSNEIYKDLWQVPDKGLATWFGALISLCAAVVLFWPTLLTTAPLVYFDTEYYYHDGHYIWGFISAKIGPYFESASSGGGGGGGGAAAAAVETGGKTLRSAGYSLFAYLTAQTPLGMVVPTILQAAITIWAFLALIPPKTQFGKSRLLLAGLLVAALSTLPWFASYAMPDILGAAVLAIYAVALARLDTLRMGQAIALLCVGIFAVAAHYGHFPLAAALAAAALFWRLIHRRLTIFAILFCVLPILVPAAGNFVSSKAALDEASVVPKRLPLLLGRSLDDGPAAWYLSEACPEAGYAMCEVFGDEIPSNLGVFLWSEGGLSSATPEQFDRIRSEEMAVLLATFRAYPLAQTHSLFRNAALQVVSVGTGKMMPSDAFNEKGQLQTRLAEANPVLVTFDYILPIATGFAVLVLFASIIMGKVPRYWVEITGLMVIGALVNAAIYGGLSAPVDRYQSRIVWLFPAILAVVFSTLSDQKE